FGEKIAKCKMPEEAEKAAKKQLDRLKGMQPSSAEYTVTRTYLEWLVELPWSIATEDHIDLPEVRKCLDEDHYDLDKVKKRIVEYMAVRKLKNDKKGPILCLVGPPGVGKTSLGRSVARAVHRDREPARPDPVGIARSPRDHRAAGLHPPGEEAHRAQVPRAQAARGSRAHDRALRDHRRGDLRDRRQLHARGRRAQPR